MNFLLSQSSSEMPTVLDAVGFHPRLKVHMNHVWAEVNSTVKSYGFGHGCEELFILKFQERRHCLQLLMQPIA